jgi:uncharacterized FlaG/YvyC family protein
MNRIDTHAGVAGILPSVGARSPSGSHRLKVPIESTAANSCLNAQLDPIRTNISFTTYGPNNEHIATVVTNQKTGEIIREIPSKVMQKVFVHLETLI